MPYCDTVKNDFDCYNEEKVYFSKILNASSTLSGSLYENCMIIQINA